MMDGDGFGCGYNSPRQARSSSMKPDSGSQAGMGRFMQSKR
ncbi:hypothetical protein LHK_01386 [Laribacter hongkongensis HLHK9]|uniref:Uncharacterized protein n=2 Tax=Laribacter hongkongensis TaxID=168471 RepID=C1D7D6_LARHH|nr:hypothetical protein LHK_01386 [Laribacter hongkongensis HLHK9]ASJ24474.1 hypothetical protein LHGZ1_1643 [Laribacter hongkongensis]